MAVLCNNVIAGASIAEEAAGDFQIEKSLRFNDNDSPYMRRDPVKAGNQQTYTFSAWFKIGHYGGGRNLFTVSANAGGSGTVARTEFGLTSDAKIIFGVNSSGSTWETLKTVGKFRDPSAWYHVCVGVDTTQSLAAARVNIYVNGILQDLTGDYPTQNIKTPYNSTNSHGIGTYINNLNDYFDGFMAEVRWIDGLQLSAAAFGSFDSNTGVWNPKDFAVPTPNQNYTYSTGSNFSVTDGGGYDPVTNPANMFDGDLTTYANQPWGGSTVTYTFPTELDVNTAITLYTSSCHRYEINPGESDATGLLDGSAGTIYVKRPASGKLKKILFNTNAGTQFQVKGIAVDGVVLKDGKTDQTYDAWKAAGHTGFSDGTDFFSKVTTTSSGGGESWGDGSDGTEIFDGSDSTGGALMANPSGNNDQTAKWTLTHTFNSVTKVRIKAYVGNSNTSYTRVRFNGSSSWKNLYTTAGSGGTHTVDCSSIIPGGGQITSIEVERLDLDSGWGFHTYFVEINDEILNVPVDKGLNSFHLKFNDTSRVGYLGKDTLNGKIADATGGLPIHNTTDDYGDVKGSGYRADSSAGTTDGTGLVFAWPGDTTTGEVHASINTGSSAKTVTANGDPSVDTTQSRLYGTSVAFDRTGDYLSVDGGTDFNFGTGDYTIECWFMTTDNSVNEGIFVLSDTSGGLATDESQHITAHVDTNGLNTRPGDGTTARLLGQGVKPNNNTWHHIAYTRASGTFRAFLDGDLKYTKTGVTTNHADQHLAIGGYYSTSYLWKGNIQDFRIYKGVAKYTASFTSPARNDFTVNNLHLADVAGVDYSGTHWAGGTVANLFDGDLSTPSAVGGGDSWHGHTFTTPLNGVTKFEVRHSADNQGQEVRIRIGSTWQTANEINSTGWNVAYDGSSIDNVTEFGIRSGNSGGCEAYAVRVNDSILVNVAATNNDSFVDSPTNYGTDTGAGGEVRGNYCTLNPLSLDSDITLAQGNLQATITANSKIAKGTLGVQNSGKWYFEVECVSDTADNNKLIGVQFLDGPNEGYVGQNYSVGYHKDGRTLYAGGQTGSTGSTWGPGDTIGVALDLSGGANNNGKVTFYKNGTAQSNGIVTTLDCTRPWTAAVNRSGSGSGTTVFSLNAGQRAFKNSAPADHKCLCTQNLDDTFSGVELNNPSNYFDIALWNGNGTAGRNIKGLKFAPDLVWCKRRDSSGGHHSFDRVRGAEWALYPNGTSYQYQDNSTLTAFNSDGFTIGNSSVMNSSSPTTTYVGWSWDAGTAASGANNDGSINISSGNQWKNATAGFSITKWTATNANATIGHGLGAPPEFIIIKNLDSNYPWGIYHKSLGAGKKLVLDSSDTESTDSGFWQDTEPTNTVFSIGNNTYFNGSTDDIIAYCWTPIPGFSSFGSYTGNGNDAGPFVWTGFSPKWVLIRQIGAANSYSITDTRRDSTNPTTGQIYADSGAAEATGTASRDRDILSNGFKPVGTSGEQNANNETYVYAAFAEHPQKLARAR